ncbi:MAG: hypothetical protein FWC19_05905 [Treponema sp.]|nr:hypothetical protein [Treponema sp.]MCL2272323.1 hypothetical protein [Treponema sp.]
MKKSVAAALLLGIILIFKVEASSISFFVVETGLPENMGVNKHSLLWEDSFMDVFFDSGYIVSNYPMIRFDAKQEGGIQDIARFDVFEAMDAGVDLVLIAKLDYSSPIEAPEAVSLYVFKVKQHEIIYERSFQGKKYGSEKDAVSDIKKIIKELAKFVVRL